MPGMVMRWRRARKAWRRALIVLAALVLAVGTVFGGLEVRSRMQEAAKQKGEPASVILVSKTEMVACPW